jgi:hypothetical protein
MGEEGTLAAMQTGLFGLRDQQRARAIEEASYLRNLPLNETIALMSGTQIQNPTFSAASPTGITPADYSGLVSENYGNLVNLQGQQVARANAKTKALASAVGTLGKVGIALM